jgi:5-formyltetrahydrofolate cyclo-ligase
MSVAEQKKDLRSQLRQRRRSLSATEQQVAAENFSKTMKAFLGVRKPRRIAVYLANDGELDPALFTQHCQRWKTEVYLPVLHPYKATMWFARYDSPDNLVDNRFGIPEPLKSPAVRPWMLDYVLFPLVGFDAQGGRLGMGGGFYDRTFAQANRWPKRPKLIGVAHDCQKVATLPLEPWDITLEAVVTDQGIYKTKD